MEIKISKLAPNKWELYKKFRLKALLSDPRAFGSSYAETLEKSDQYWQDRLKAALAGQDSWMLFAMAEDQLVGMTGAYIEKEGDIAEIISVFVEPEVRGNGIAGRLMESILTEVKQNKKLHKARLTVNPLQEAAVKLYEKYGFEKIGEQKQILGDGKEYDEYIMIRELL